MENFIFCANATNYLDMSYLGLCRYFEIIADIAEIINSTHYYLFTESISFRDERLHFTGTKPSSPDNLRKFSSILLHLQQ